MPTPRPISVASVGANVAMSITCASRPVRLSPQPSASTAREQRQQRRPQRAEGDREHDRGGDEADELARPAARLLRGLLDPAAAELDLQPVAARVLGGGDQLVVGGLRHVGDRLLAVHVHVGERDRAVLGDLPRGGALRERAVDALDVRALGDRRRASSRSAP